MDDVDRDMKMVDRKERWRTTEYDGEEPSMTTPDDVTRGKEDK